MNDARITVGMKLDGGLSNEELQDAIVQTRAMIRATTPAEKMLTMLEKHLEGLLRVQMARAAMVTVDSEQEKA